MILLMKWPCTNYRQNLGNFDEENQSNYTFTYLINFCESHSIQQLLLLSDPNKYLLYSLKTQWSTTNINIF